MQFVVSVMMGLTVGGWCFAVYHGLRLLLQHRDEDRSLSSYLFNGMVWIDRGSWAPSGAEHHRKMLIGMAGFALGMLGSGLGIALTAPR